MKYPLILVTSLLSANHLASSKGPMMFIRPQYKGSQEIYLHELEHVKQWWAWFIPLAALAAYLYSIETVAFFPVAFASLLAHNMFYEFSRAYRLWAEVMAYRKQAMGKDSALPIFAKHLAANYDLRITPEQALESLKG